jgi:4-hydroxy-2-oxoheptanedioate aldolase
MPASNPFKQAIAEQRLQLGLWQALASPLTVELCAGAGFDWLLLDGEHGPNDPPTLLAQLQAMSGSTTHPVGRPPVGETWIIKQYLDIGFRTLLIPMVDTPEQAARIVAACRYPPDGARGVGSGIVRASGFNRRSDYLQVADDEICVLVQIETREGLSNLEGIVRTQGIDGVFIGPADLSAALGHRGAPSHPEVQAEIARALDVIRAAGKPAGILMADETLAQRHIEQGFTFVAIGTDVGLLVKATNGLLDRFRPSPPKVISPSVY